MVNASLAPTTGVNVFAVIRYALSAPTVGERVGAVPPVAAAVSVGVLDDAVSSFELSTLCATSVVAAPVPLVKLIVVPVPIAVPLTVAREPSGAAVKPPKVIVLLPVKLDKF